MSHFKELSSNETAQKSLYGKCAKKYGLNAKGLGWQDITTQQKRFGVLISGIKEQNASMLDVGCGLGDLYDYLVSKNLKFKYTGIDIMGDFIEEAKKRRPNVTFLRRHIVKEPLGTKFDVTIASGIFAFADRHALEQTIKTMYKHTNKMMAFNILINERSGGFLKVTLKDVLDICNELGARNILYKDGYLANDTTFWITR